MQSSNIPSKIPLPFAYNAGPSYKNTIPTASQIGITNGRASLADGFPPLTFTPINSGGVPPFGSDMNGILYEITAIQQWQQAGGYFAYDSSFASTIGGYPAKSVIQDASGNGFWLSAIDNNSNNPSSGSGGTSNGWLPLSFYGTQSIALSGSSVTLTNANAGYPIIILTGALTSACNVIMPTFAGRWVIVNNTTGSYTVQVKTAAGTGVNVAQGFSTSIYGDASSIYYANSAQVSSFNTRTGAVTLNATDVTTALGYVPPTPTGGGASGTWGISISGNAATATNATNGRYVYDNGSYGGTVGYKEATSVQNFYSATSGNANNSRYVYSDGAYGGSVGYVNPTALQVYYAANAGTAALAAGQDNTNAWGFASGNFGRPYMRFTATNAVQELVPLASFGSQTNQTGFQRLPSGIIIQWGKIVATDDAYIYTAFPLTFVSGCYNVVAVLESTGALTGNQVGAAAVGNFSTSGFYVANGTYVGGSPFTGYAYYIAIGF